MQRKTNNKIKVSVPMPNRHICYVAPEYRTKISAIKKKTGLSLYQLLCTCSNTDLSDSECMKAFKDTVRANGFRTIGKWAEALLELLHDELDRIQLIDLSSIKLVRVEEGVLNAQYDISSN